MQTTSKKNRNNLLFTDTTSTFSEAFQHLQVNLNFSFIGEENNILAITSPLAGEGKSTVTANLAYIYAKKGYKVLVIDLDLRKPNIHRFFNLSNDKGITDYCAKEATVEEIINHFESIDIITAGTHTPLPGKVLESEILFDLINSLKVKYDYVLIDTPPVILTSDAMICSKFAPSYLIVIDYGKSKKSDFEEVIRQFKADSKINIAGVVMNKMKVTKTEYDYKYRYSYGKENNK